MRYISVPINKEAMQRLDYDTCIEGDLVELSLDENSYNTLWKTGLFTTINQRIGILIDDYEYENVTDIPDIIELKEIVEEYTKNNKDIHTLFDLIRLITIAVENETGIFFYF